MPDLEDYFNNEEEFKISLKYMVDLKMLERLGFSKEDIDKYLIENKRSYNNEMRKYYTLKKMEIPEWCKND